MEKFESVLKLEKLLFDNINFKRKGFKNGNKIELKLQVQISHEPNDVYRIGLTFIGEKRDEYSLEIALSGYFSFEGNEEIPEDIRTNLLNKNAVAILMPYLRSQVSLLTAQPEVDCIILPPFNINKMMEEN